MYQNICGLITSSFSESNFEHLEIDNPASLAVANSSQKPIAFLIRQHMFLPIEGAGEIGDAEQHSILLENLDVSLIIESAEAWSQLCVIMNCTFSVRNMVQPFL